MKKKIAVIGVLIILSALFLTQTAAVHAGKQANMLWIKWTTNIDSVSEIYKDGRLYIRQVQTSGAIWKGVLDPLGDYVSVETIVFYYDGAGNEKCWVSNEELKITHGLQDTLTIQAKFKYTYGVVSLTGSWTIVGGTGLWAAISGRGVWEYPTHYWGKIS